MVMNTFDYYGDIFKKPAGRPVRAPGTITGQVQEPGKTTTSPALAGMEKSPFAGFLGSLGQPVDVPYTNLQQQRYNLMRGQIQGATRTAGEQMKTWMGGKGFRAGESGVADAPLMQIARGGQEQLSRAAGGLAAEEARIQQGMGLQTAGLDLQRLLGGGQLALAGEEGIQNRLLQYLALLSGTEQGRFQPYWQGVAGAYGG